MGGMIKCLECGLLLHSMYRHDFQACDCSNHAFVDGGFDYQRTGAADFDKVEVVSHRHEKHDGPAPVSTILDYFALTEVMEDEKKAYNLKKENQDEKDVDSTNS